MVPNNRRGVCSSQHHNTMSKESTRNSSNQAPDIFIHKGWHDHLCRFFILSRSLTAAFYILLKILQ